MFDYYGGSLIWVSEHSGITGVNHGPASGELVYTWVFLRRLCGHDFTWDFQRQK